MLSFCEVSSLSGRDGWIHLYNFARPFPTHLHVRQRKGWTCLCLALSMRTEQLCAFQLSWSLAVGEPPIIPYIMRVELNPAPPNNHFAPRAEDVSIDDLF